MKAIKATVALCVAMLANASYADTMDYMKMARLNANNAGFEQYSILSEGESRTYTMNTEVGERYAVIGVCDADCRDLDLAVFREGARIASDFQLDNNPIIQFVAHATSYDIRVDMESCDRSYCFFRVEGFKK